MKLIITELPKVSRTHMLGIKLKLKLSWLFIRVDKVKNREFCAGHRALALLYWRALDENLNYWKKHRTALIVVAVIYCKNKGCTKILEYCLQIVSSFLLKVSPANNSRTSPNRCRRNSTRTRVTNEAHSGQYWKDQFFLFPLSKAAPSPCGFRMNCTVCSPFSPWQWSGLSWASPGSHPVSKPQVCCLLLYLPPRLVLLQALRGYNCYQSLPRIAPGALHSKWAAPTISHRVWFLTATPKSRRDQCWRVHVPALQASAVNSVAQFNIKKHNLHGATNFQKYYTELKYNNI